MNVKRLFTLILSAALTFSFPASVYAAETAPAYDTSEDDAANEEDAVEPGVQTVDDGEENDVELSTFSKKVFPCYFYEIETVSPAFLENGDFGGFVMCQLG